MSQVFTPGYRLGPAFCLRLVAVLVAFIPLAPSPLKAQQTPPQEVSSHDVQPTFKLQTERNLVTVRVIVRNRKGQTVDNLRQEDFQLLDDGKKQTIVQFSVEMPAVSAAKEPAPKPQEAGADKGKPSFISFPGRFVALYFDDVNTEFVELAYSRDAADRFLRASLHPTDRVGLYRASGLNPVDFTDDLAKLHQALFELRPRPVIRPDPTCGAISPYQAYLIVEAHDTIAQNLAAEELRNCGDLGNSHTSSSWVQMLVENKARQTLADAEVNAQAALRGIESLVRRMSTLPGQRSMVIVSNGFLSQTQGAALSLISDLALRSNIVINGLDARGLYVGGASADASQRGSALNRADMVAQKDMMMREGALRQSEGIGTLALDTGGILFNNNNDLEAGLRLAAAVPDTYYTLAFSPQNLKHDAAFHPLKVTLVSPKGLSVQARRGYYAPAKSADLAGQEKEDIQSAVFSQTEMQELPIQVNTQFFMTARADAEIDVMTHLGLQRANFRKEADRNLENLTFVTALFDGDGHYVAGQQKTIEMHLRDMTLEQFLRTGIKVQTEFNVKPGLYLIRAVVRDSASGQISVLNRTLQIPN